MNYYQLIFKCSFNDTEFNEGRTYIFKSELDLKKGDYVVAMTRYGYSIAVVYEKNDVDVQNYYGGTVAKIVTKLDGNYYEEKENAERLEMIEKLMNQKVKEMDKVIKFEAIAKYDPTAKELLEEYKKLANGNQNQILLESSEIEENLPF